MSSPACGQTCLPNAPASSGPGLSAPVLQIGHIDQEGVRTHAGRGPALPGQKMVRAGHGSAVEAADTSSMPRPSSQAIRSLATALPETASFRGGVPEPETPGLTGGGDNAALQHQHTAQPVSTSGGASSFSFVCRHRTCRWSGAPPCLTTAGAGLLVPSSGQAGSGFLSCSWTRAVPRVPFALGRMFGRPHAILELKGKRFSRATLVSAMRQRSDTVSPIFPGTVAASFLMTGSIPARTYALAGTGLLLVCNMAAHMSITSTRFPTSAWRAVMASSDPPTTSEFPLPDDMIQFPVMTADIRKQGFFGSEVLLFP